MGVSLTTLITRVRQRADMENTKFVTDTEITTFINASYKELYGILVQKFEDYNVTSSTFTISSGNTSALPSDFFKLIGLDMSIGGRYVPLRKFNFNERNRTGVGYRSARPIVTYRILGSNFYLAPESQALGSYKAWYVPTVTELSAGSDELSGVNGWEEYVVIDAAIKCLVKEESDITPLQLAKTAMLKRIEEEAQNRDAGTPERITDVTYADDEEWY